jgi:hypothetical protein
MDVHIKNVLQVSTCLKKFSFFCNYFVLSLAVDASMISVIRLPVPTRFWHCIEREKSLWFSGDLRKSIQTLG